MGYKTAVEMVANLADRRADLSVVLMDDKRDLASAASLVGKKTPLLAVDVEGWRAGYDVCSAVGLVELLDESSDCIMVGRFVAMWDLQMVDCLVSL